MSEFVFNPTRDQIEYSNIWKFMKTHNLDSLNSLYEKSIDNLEWFWKQVEKDIGIVWNEPYSKVLDTANGIQWPKWFVNGKTNIVSSSVEKFSKQYPNKIAYYFVSEDGNLSSITYSQLNKEVNMLANSLKNLGVKKGDVVAIFLPMIKEAIIAILASAKIGAIQTVIFSGYSTDSLKIRLEDCNAKVLFTSDGFHRKGKIISQKRIVLDAIKNTNVENIILVPYKGVDAYDSDLVIKYDDFVSSTSENCETEVMDSEDPLFILYTSGTTGKPKGVVHSHGGFSVFAGHQSAYLIDNHPEDVVFWPADIGWITGLVWNVYGLLLVGSTGIIYDGALDYPDNKRIWKIIQDFEVTIFGISPTAVRMFRRQNLNPSEMFSLDALRNIPTTGEPIDEQSWWWLFDKVGMKKIPIMNLSGGTEIGGAMLSVLPGMSLKPSTVGMPCPGINLDVFDDDGKSIKNQKGYLVIKSPWPAMTKGLLNDKNRYLETYWSKFPDIWFHGDYVLVDENGLWYMHGRVDDVINVSGHRLSTAEI
ncbi:MAG: AMP-binding protein, partial [Nitrosopumilaceae archaeon]|nr:acetate--CoA ligase [Nitrosopumilaceae archaeon]NIU01152.1 acetate--CoA ligase [Nitrosopumilaceae archaeon]NIU87525.1 AMP-binding protein [Nitrosopumilaceae archaeon]NIV65988.1 AMP-binding protein [Nitrosopumilaceae archaeon]NIX61754.1 AMP-binding protein [Nitrosopumilaceae archaeon]